MNALRVLGSEPGAYAGIGSRQTPEDVRNLMERIADKLVYSGWTLRTGGAEGADEAFLDGCSPLHETVELYLPWPGFNEWQHVWKGLTRPTAIAYELAQRFHPAWSRLSSGARALQARNVHQVLGKDCETPAKFILCWTTDGATEKTTGRTGGTGQAIRIANAYGIRVWNLQRPDHRQDWEGE